MKNALLWVLFVQNSWAILNNTLSEIFRLSNMHNLFLFGNSHWENVWIIFLYISRSLDHHNISNTKFLCKFWNFSEESYLNNFVSFWCEGHLSWFCDYLLKLGVEFCNKSLVFSFCCFYKVMMAFLQIRYLPNKVRIAILWDEKTRDWGDDCNDESIVHRFFLSKLSLDMFKRNKSEVLEFLLESFWVDDDCFLLQHDLLKRLSTCSLLLFFQFCLLFNLLSIHFFSFHFQLFQSFLMGNLSLVLELFCFNLVL